MMREPLSRLDQDESLRSATYVSGLLEVHVLERNEDGMYSSNRQDIHLISRIERISGIIESSLYNAFTALGEKPKLIHAYAVKRQL